MSDPVWFDQAYYLQEKANALNASGDGSVTWDSESVLLAIESAGITPYEHYRIYGDAEGLSPNQYFDQNYYLSAKVAELNTTEAGGRTDWTTSEVLQAIENGGLTAFEHFSRYGVTEGLDPSDSFDAQAYLQEKADALNAADGGTTWTPSLVLDAMESAGLDPVSHYMGYGSHEGMAVTPVTSGGLFTVTYDANTHAVSFSGTATGDIDVSIDSGVATFTRGGHEAATTVDDLAHAVITLGAGQTLAIDHTEATALAGATLTGTGTLKATDAVTVAEFSGLHFDAAWSGHVNYSVEDTVAVLSAVTPVSLAGVTHVTARVTSDLDLTNNVLWTSVDQIDLNDQNNVILAAHTQANLTIVDTADNDTSNNTGITAKVQAGHTDLTDVTLNSAIDTIDLNGQAATLSVAEATKAVIATGGGSYTVMSGDGADTITLANALTASVKYTSTNQFGDSLVFGSGATDRIDISALAGDGLVNSGGSMNGNTASSMSTSSGGFVVSLSAAVTDSWLGSSAHLEDVAGFIHDHLGTISSPGDDYLLIHGTTSSALYLFRDTGDGTVQAGELTLVAVVGSVLTDSSVIISA